MSMDAKRRADISRLRAQMDTTSPQILLTARHQTSTTRPPSSLTSAYSAGDLLLTGTGERRRKPSIRDLPPVPNAPTLPTQPPPRPTRAKSGDMLKRDQSSSSMTHSKSYTEEQKSTITPLSFSITGFSTAPNLQTRQITSRAPSRAGSVASKRTTQSREDQNPVIGMIWKPGGGMGTHARDVFFKNKERAKAVALKARFELRRSKGEDDEEEEEMEDEVKVEDLDIVQRKMSVRADGYEDVLLIEEALLGRRISRLVEGEVQEREVKEEELRRCSLSWFRVHHTLGAESLPFWKAQGPDRFAFISHLSDNPHDLPTKPLGAEPEHTKAVAG
ncbi:hypothetical protein HK097_002185, partial [Rhizophlyctis rosea]